MTTAINYIRDPHTGRLWPIPAGGSGEGDGDGDEPEGGGGEPTPLQQEALDAIEQLRDAGTEIPQALEAAVSEVSDARSEAAGYRTELRQVQKAQQQQAETLQELAKALGVNGDDPDVDDLQSQVDELQRRNRSLQLADAVGKVASQVGADPDLLHMYLQSSDKLDDLDLDSDDVNDKITEMAQEAIEAKPQLQVGVGGTADQGARGTSSAPADIEPGAARLRHAYSNSS